MGKRYETLGTRLEDSSATVGRIFQNRTTHRSSRSRAEKAFAVGRWMADEVHHAKTIPTPERSAGQGKTVSLKPWVSVPLSLDTEALQVRQECIPISIRQESVCPTNRKQ